MVTVQCSKAQYEVQYNIAERFARGAVQCAALHCVAVQCSALRYGGGGSRKASPGWSCRNGRSREWKRSDRPTTCATSKHQQQLLLLPLDDDDDGMAAIPLRGCGGVRPVMGDSIAAWGAGGGCCGCRLAVEAVSVRPPSRGCCCDCDCCCCCCKYSRTSAPSSKASCRAFSWLLIVFPVAMHTSRMRSSLSFWILSAPPPVGCEHEHESRS